MTTAAHTSLPTLDDIVFEGRNKAYGAYVLRKAYGRHVTTATVLSTGLAALLIAIPLVVQQLWPAKVIVPTEPLPTTDVVLSDYTIDLPKPPKPVAAATVTVRPSTPPIPTKVVENTKVLPPTPTEVIAVSDGPAVDGPVAKEGDGAVGSNTGAFNGTDTVAQPAEPAVLKPFLHVEVMPEFTGGAAALTKYMQRNLHYPPQALRASVEGKVYVSFTVAPDGSITDVDVLKGLGYGTDEEAARVIRQMPTWKPGYQNNHAVPVRYTLPITFQYE